MIKSDLENVHISDIVTIKYLDKKPLTGKHALVFMLIFNTKLMTSGEILEAHKYASQCTKADSKFIMETVIKNGLDDNIIDLLVEEQMLSPWFSVLFNLDKKSVLEYFSKAHISKEALDKLLMEIDMTFISTDFSETYGNDLLESVKIYLEIASVIQNPKTEKIIMDELREYTKEVERTVGFNDVLYTIKLMLGMLQCPEETIDEIVGDDIDGEHE